MHSSESSVTNSNSGRFILDGHTPVPCADLLEWAAWLESADRLVVRDEIGEVIVSTVFLGLDHSFGRSEPVLFETMIFGGPQDGYTERCSTWDQAVIQHGSVVENIARG